jgi:outer membrane protein assembly factor BamA
MSQSLCSIKQSVGLILSLCILALGFSSVVAQEVADSPRPALDIDGNKNLSKAVLLDNINSQLDKNGSRYNSQILDYCLHRLDAFIKSNGYLQAKVTAGNVEQTDTGPRLLLTVVEGPLYRVGKITVDEARLFTAQQVLAEIGVKTGEIANGEKLSDGLYERLKARYAKFGYVQYTAEVDPTFHAASGDPEGVVDLAITIDEGEQFKIRSIKIAGADNAVTEMLTRELLLRAGDIFDEELFHESVKRMNRTALVDTIDRERDVDFTDLRDKQRQLAFDRRIENPDLGPALLDIVIHVNKAGTTPTQKTQRAGVVTLAH